jgi:hypothetical protein
MLCITRGSPVLPGTRAAAAAVIQVRAAELSGGEVVRKRHPPEELDVRRVPAGVVRRALSELHAVGQARRGVVHVQRSPHLPQRDGSKLSIITD